MLYRARACVTRRSKGFLIGRADRPSDGAVHGTASKNPYFTAVSTALVEVYSEGAYLCYKIVRKYQPNLSENGLNKQTWMGS